MAGRNHPGGRAVSTRSRAPEGEPDLAALLRILWRRRLWIAVPTLLALLLALAVLVLAPPRYRAEAVVAVGPALAAPDLVPGAPAPPEPAEREIDSLAGLLAAEPVRAAALDRLRRDGLIGGHAPPPVAEVIRRTRTRLLAVRVEHGDPAIAAAYADTLVEVFLAERRRRLEAAVREATGVVEARLAEVRARREQLERRIAGLVAARLEPEGGALAARPERLALLEDELVRARTERAALEAELAALRGVPEGAPAPGGGGALERLLAMRAELARRQAELAGELGPRHPEVQRLEREVAALDSRIAHERERLFALRRADLVRLRERERRLAAELDRLRAEAARQEELGRELEGLRAGLSDLVARERELERRVEEARTRILLAAPALEWVERARPPDAPAFPRPLPLLGFALLAGGGFGLLAVAVLELLARGVGEPAELERLLEAPVTALPALPPALARRVGLADLPLELPDSPQDAALGRLLAQLGVPAAAPGRTLAVLGCRPGEGTSALALALARHAALHGIATVLVDGHPAGAGLRSRLALPGGPGVGEALSRGLDPLPLLCDDPLTPLRLLPASAGGGAGAAPPAAVAALLARLGQRFALVVVDVPAPERTAEGLPFVRAADVVVPVVRARATPVEAVRALAATLAGLGVRPAAAVLLGVADGPPAPVRRAGAVAALRRRTREWRAVHG